MMFFAFVNLAAGLTAFLFACEELAEKRRWLWQPSGWIYAAMTVGGVIVAWHGFLEAHHPTEVFFNAVVAMHFARKIWQGRQKRQTAAQAALPETAPPVRRRRAKPRKRRRR